MIPRTAILCISLSMNLPPVRTTLTGRLAADFVLHLLMGCTVKLLDGERSGVIASNMASEHLGIRELHCLKMSTHTEVQGGPLNDTAMRCIARQ